MKKVIALILALIMTFSMGTVAFAEGDVTEAPETNAPVEGGDEAADEEEAAEEEKDSLLGEYDWILDLPFGTVKPALKIAKIVLKLAKVYVKLGVIFGFVDKDALMEQVYDFIGGLIGSEEAPEADTTPADGVELVVA